MSRVPERPPSSESRPAPGPVALYQLRAACLDDGALLIGLAVLSAIALFEFLPHQPYFWPGVISAALLFTVGFVALNRFRGAWLQSLLERAVEPPPGAAVGSHPLARDLGVMIVVWAAFNAVAVMAIVAVHLGLSYVALVPGMAVAQGMTSLDRWEQIRGWERDHDDELLVSRFRRSRAYYLRSLAGAAPHLPAA